MPSFFRTWGSRAVVALPAAALLAGICGPGAASASTQHAVTLVGSGGPRTTEATLQAPLAAGPAPASSSVHRPAARPLLTAARRLSTPSAVRSTVAAQINAVRRQYRLPEGRLTLHYDGAVQSAAAGDRDPVILVEGHVLGEYGLWGVLPRSAPLSSATTRHLVHDWVDTDGWHGAGTTNLDCTSAAAPGCDAHRRALLSKPPTPGAHLSIDVAYTRTAWEGRPALSLAVLLLWSH